ncbi:MAG: hypothetical protein JWR58_6969, partial [Pseudonocardia sp.]|nr:hypothetical protein [Pseudonocardia sp.]
SATATTYRILSELGLPTTVPNAGRLLSGEYADPGGIVRIAAATS